MRNLFLIFLMALTALSCATSNRFKVGDCVIHKSDAELWERPEPIIEKITEIGVKKYHIKFYNNGRFIYSYYFPNLDYIYIGDEDYYSIVECPKEGLK